MIGGRSAAVVCCGSRSASTLARTIGELKSARQQFAASERVGLVPTMGALHDGHVELVKAARKVCDRVVVSIFVNPTQFLPGEDFNKYPRQLDADRLKLADLADVVFAPSPADMYPPTPAPHATFVSVADADSSAEGSKRPGHFRGVATVCLKLFNLVQPHTVVFGQKDGMQCIVLRRVIRELNVPVRMLVVPTVRESDGLARSSRNVYLSPADRRVAPVLARALRAAEQAYGSGERRVSALREAALSVLAAEPTAHVQYVSLACPNTGHELAADARLPELALALEPEPEPEPENSSREAVGLVDERPVAAMLSLAVQVGRTRLIDNVLLGRPSFAN